VFRVWRVPADAPEVPIRPEADTAATKACGLDEDLSHCGGEIKVDARKCKHCRRMLDGPQPTVMNSGASASRCPNCGSEVAQGFVFCGSCGANCETETALATEASRERQPKGKNTRMKVILAVIICALIIIVCGVVYYSSAIGDFIQSGGGEVMRTEDW